MNGSTVAALSREEVARLRPDRYVCDGCGQSVVLLADEPLPTGWVTRERLVGRRIDGTVYRCPACAIKGDTQCL